jgi:nucleoside-diphosphate-sugar epimerase
MKSSLRVLVSGASGYLGQAAVSSLAAAGHHVIACSREGRPVGAASEVTALDITDPERTHRVVEVCRPDVVLHLAAFIPTGTEDAADVECSDRVNRGGTQNLAEAARNVGIERFIFASSISVYAAAPRDGVAFHENDALDPRGAYGRHKAAAESLLASRLSDRCAVVCLRFSGVHGPPRRSGVIFRYCEAARAGAPLNVAEPGSLFNFLWRRDAARACRAALETPLPLGEHVFNIAGGVPVSLQDLARQVVARMNSKSEVILGEGPERRQVMDISAARRVLGFAPAAQDDLVAAVCDDL